MILSGEMCSTEEVLVENLDLDLSCLKDGQDVDKLLKTIAEKEVTFSFMG